MNIRAEINHIIVQKMIHRQIEMDRKGVGDIGAMKSKEDLALEATDEIIELVKKQFRPEK
jgi:hypothetical protein